MKSIIKIFKNYFAVLLAVLYFISIYSNNEIVSKISTSILFIGFTWYCLNMKNKKIGLIIYITTILIIIKNIV